MDLTHVRFQGTPTTATPLPAGLRPASPRLVRRDLARAPAPALSGLPAMVLRAAGLHPERYRAAPLERRTNACLRALRLEDEAHAMSRLYARPQLLGTALDALLIGVSGFFRDSVVFQTMRRRVLPALPQGGGPLRVLSLGCSTGEELYSAAILLADAGLLERAELLGVDCRASAVACAARGVFAEASLADIDPAVRAQHFEPSSEGWRVAERLRQKTSWQVLDATNDCPRGPWDVVLCRNVLIYLDECAAHAMLERIAGELRTAGFLVLGKAERPHPALRLATIGRSLYQRHDA